MRFYTLTSAGHIMHISRFPGIYCSLLPWCKHCGPRSSPLHTMDFYLQLSVADKSYIVCTSEKHVSRDFRSFMKQFHRIGHCYIS